MKKYKKPINVIVDNRFRIKTKDIGDEVVPKLYKLFSHHNPQHYKLKKMGYKAWKEPKVVDTWSIDVDDYGVEWLSLPRGGSDRIRGAFNANGFIPNFVDCRSEGVDECLLALAAGFPEHNVDLWEHQERIVKSVIEKQNCIVRAGTGGGKTTAALAAISRIKLPSIVIVWESGLMRQWLERIEFELGMNSDDIGIIGSGSNTIRPLTIAMQQSLNRLSDERWREVNNSFGVVVADELSRFAASTFQKTIDRFSAKYRIGMSAEEKRKDQKEFLIYDLFGDIKIEITAAELVASGIVHDVEVRVVPTEFSADWYVAQRRRKSGVPDFNRLLNEMTINKDRNELIARIVAKATHGDRKALVFSHRVEHCRKLDSTFAAFGMKSGVMVGEDQEQYRETVLGLRDGSRQVGIGTFGKIGLGLDLPAVAAGVVATPCHNNRPQWIQITGRICRTAKGKTDAVLWYLWDHRVHGLQPLYNLRRWNKEVFVEDDNSEWVDINDYLDDAKGSKE